MTPARCHGHIRLGDVLEAFRRLRPTDRAPLLGCADNPRRRGDRVNRRVGRACKLIFNREPVEALTRHLSFALFMDAKLDLGHKRVRAKAPA
jgi:hypothetical protein